MTFSSSRRFYVLFAAAVLWMAVIFYKSAEPYQQQSLIPFLSKQFSASHLSNWLPHIAFTYDRELVTWRDPYGMLEFFIRKAGHVSEYILLSLLLGYAGITKPIKRSTAIVSSALFSILYAASDEWHQKYVPGRTGHAIDVAIDSIGILLTIGWLFWSRPRIKRSI
jgi:VanZ family protein